jgi:carnitine O-acetyltransferase
MPSSTTTVRLFTMPKSLNESLAEPGQPQFASEGGRSLEGAKKASEQFTKDEHDPLASSQLEVKHGITFAAQDKLPKLPIPDLEKTTARYLSALKPLQSPREHSDTRHAVEDFLKAEGPELNERLKKYATGKTSYIEQFCKQQLFMQGDRLRPSKGMTRI